MVVWTDRYRIVLMGIVLFSNALFAADTTTKYLPVISGHASFEAGEIMKGYSSAAGAELTRAWLESGEIGLCADAAINDRLRVLVAGEGQLLISFRRFENGSNDAYAELRQSHTLFLIKRGEALYTIGSTAHPLLQVEAGFFPYKYNSDVRNLGEYLFRTYCYPASMMNEFDKPYADLVGFRVGNSIVIGTGSIRHDLLLTTETKIFPFADWSLSYVADYSIPQLISLGAGVQLFDVFSVGADNSQLGIDPTTPDPNLMSGKNYTFAGTKIMARLSFDVKGLFPGYVPFAGLFGKEDLKLYGEAAILGLKNYKDTTSGSDDGYDTLSWRVPLMVGINLPSFKVLDVLSMELEYLDSPYPNGTINPTYLMTPLPESRAVHEKLKWSLYAKKSCGSHVSIIGQIANDHVIPKTTVMANNFADATDVTLRHGDWWWIMKMRFDF